jgi:hypothetical protein
MVAKHFEGLTEHQGSLLLEIEHPTSSANPRVSGPTDIDQKGHGHVASTRSIAQVESIGRWASSALGRKIVDICIEIQIGAIELLRVAPPNGTERVETPTDVID